MSRWLTSARNSCSRSLQNARNGAASIVTTKLPFSEWTTVFPNPRLCKPLLDRVTDRAHIIETGTESFRFKRTMEEKKKHWQRPAVPSKATPAYVPHEPRHPFRAAMLHSRWVGCSSPAKMGKL
jgi:hypothetical protein